MTSDKVVIYGGIYDVPINDVASVTAPMTVVGNERLRSAGACQHEGDWEIDTVMGQGSNACIVTLVERKTGFTLIGKLPNRTTTVLNQRTNSLMMRYSQKFKAITADNVTEFHQYREIEKVTGVRFYFAIPYPSWKRGTHENTNGMIRQYLPKGMSIQAVTQAECDKIAWALNSHPRERLAKSHGGSNL
ncbi:transposase [Elysia marginata]|uniref:Transposase n=1 Tax=Elysia marginata TaxID=1093978 RepID=A0AAV4EF86_9GAST|nr:transposase [Elysia marginata]